MLFFGALISLVLTAPRIFHYLKEEHAKIKEKSKIIAISFYKPPDYGMVRQYIQGGGKDATTLSIKKDGYASFGAFRDYYVFLTEYVGNNAQLWFVQGVFQYLLLDKERAEQSFLQSIKLDPYYFWTYHNLALIFWEKDYCGHGLDQIILRAQSLPESTVSFMIHDAPVFKPFWKGLSDPQQVIHQNYVTGVKNIEWMKDHCGPGAPRFDSLKAFFF